MEARTGYVGVPGGRLYYEAMGDGPALVLIHAGVADHRMWDEQCAEFARHFRVVRYDIRGCGRSPTEDVEFSHREDLRALLAHLKITRAALIGVSIGGQIAVDFTLESPEMVTALIPVAAGVSGGLPDHQNTAIETRLVTDMEDAWEKKEFDRLVDLEVRLWVDGPGQPADRVASPVRERVRQMERENLERNTTEGKPQPLKPPAIGRLGEIRVPTLVVSGELDTSRVMATADLLARSIPEARQVVVPETAHMLSMEKPAEFGAIVLDFLRPALGV